MARISRAVIAVALATLGASPALAQLTPPPGAVAPTQSIEIFSVPFTITQPGSYRVARNLTATGPEPMISVQAKDVTLDLGGHTLDGAGIAIYGIFIEGDGDRLHVRNGQVTNTVGSNVVANFRTITIEDMILSASVSGNGIGAASGQPAIVRNVLVQNPGFNGVALSPGSVAENVVVVGAGNDGFSVSSRSVFRNCVALDCARHGFFFGTNGGAVLENCSANDNGGTGFWLRPGSVVRGGHAERNGQERARDRGGAAPPARPQDGPSFDAAGAEPIPHPHDGYENPIVVDRRTGEQIAGLVTLPLAPRDRGLTSGGDGIRAGAGCTIEACVVLNNHGDGIAAGDGSTVIGCTARDNFNNGILVGASATVSRCTTTNNDAHGIVAGLSCHISDCTANGNGATGILADDQSMLERCPASSNGANGFQADIACSLIGCIARGSTSSGILVSGEDSVVRDCTARANGAEGIFVDSGSGAHIRGCHVATNLGHGIRIVGTFAFVIHNHVEADSIQSEQSSNRIGPIHTGTDLTTAPVWANFRF